MATMTRERGGYRSLFWPMLLIGVGAIWLLANLGFIGLQNLVVAARLWPLLLMVAGVDLLFGRRSPSMGALIGLGTVAVIVALMVVGPSLGLGYDIETTTLQDREPLGDATSAQIDIGINAGTGSISALSDSSQLIDFDIIALGEVDYQVTGQTQKVVRLSQPNQNYDGLVGLVIGLFGTNNDDIRWNIGLSPDVPLDLRLSGGTGGFNLDLRDLTLTNLEVNVATGGTDISLPANDEPYDLRINSATGGGTLRIPEGASLNIDISVATGGFTVDVPEGAAVRVHGSVATGSITVPSSFNRLSGDDDSRFVGDEGVWETGGYNSASRKINIEFDGATGGLTVQ